MNLFLSLKCNYKALSHGTLVHGLRHKHSHEVNLGLEPIYFKY